MPREKKYIRARSPRARLRGTLAHHDQSTDQLLCVLKESNKKSPALEFHLTGCGMLSKFA
jgi:hypothetical protein